RTNGSTAAGYLAAALGSPLVLPTANNIGTKSINFAETSAKVNSQSANGPTSLTNQVNNFSQLVGNGSASFDSDDTLFFLAGGLNDRTTNPNNVINGYKQQVAELVSLGARFIEITLLPSEIPPFLVSADKFNDLYANLVAELNALYSHVSITLSDWGTYFDDIILNPSDYGMSNVTDAYLDVGQPGVDDPDTFFYYYPAHPSDAAHEIVGDKLYDETLTLTEMSPELQISGQGYEVTTFTHQNNSYDFTVSGGSLRQGTNVWTAVDIGTYVVTANTVLRFEFSSTDE
ncbi:MAG: SGNH/GDSL hydrolase family protein, partial [Cellvibrionaceae bacterium]|nr:SGNH/GDSL hydrolase family protein [Cellvibrionaceae bacterium]